MGIMEKNRETTMIGYMGVIYYHGLHRGCLLERVIRGLFMDEYREMTMWFHSLRHLSVKRR